jgi:hypothetical protein
VRRAVIRGGQRARGAPGPSQLERRWAWLPITFGYVGRGHRGAPTGRLWVAADKPGRERSERDQAAERRDEAAFRRDRAADQRDRNVALRDAAAAQRDKAAEESEQPVGSQVSAEALDQSAADREDAFRSAGRSRGSTCRSPRTHGRRARPLQRARRPRRIPARTRRPDHRLTSRGTTARRFQGGLATS